MRTLAITLEELAPAALTPVDVTASSLPPSLNEFGHPDARSLLLLVLRRLRRGRQRSSSDGARSRHDCHRERMHRPQEKAKSNRPSSERVAAAGTARALQHTLSSASHTPSSMRLGSLARRQKRSQSSPRRQRGGRSSAAPKEVAACADGQQ